MKRWNIWLVTGIVAVVTVWGTCASVGADDLGGKSCEELLRLARECEADLKTVDMVLGAAIDAGNMDKIKSYKLKKGSTIKLRDQIMNAIRFKGCVPVK